MIRFLKRLLRRFLTIKKVVHLDITYCNPSSRFAGKHVMVVGGSSGIGLAVAKAFLSEGAEVVVCARHEKRMMDAYAGDNSGRVRMMALDVAKVDDIPTVISNADRTMNGVDIFVNCAGVSAFDGSADTEEMYDYICDINTKGLFFLNKHEGDYMIERNIKGKIVNITSKAGERIGFDPYILSKWGANSITKGNARRLAPYHINVNGVAPGKCPTNITADLQQHIDCLSGGNAFTTGHATERFTLPDEVASMVLYLSSGVANNIVGQIVVMDGGSYW